ncbi:MAG: hypothetical protein Q7Q73_08930 [Verrucomicrobiota bacterium JB024]|nr:hypothetical protein [Verrucomicrobiota bacterium JB024]
MENVLIRFINVIIDDVSADQIDRFCRFDMGYPDYINRWSWIVEKREVPDEVDFEITEVISSLGRYDWYACRDDECMGFRRLVCLVGLYYYTLGKVDDTVRPLNYILMDILFNFEYVDDCAKALLRDALVYARDRLREVREPEFPFVALALFALSCRIGDLLAGDKYRRMLMRDNHAVRSDESLCYYFYDNEFIIGLTPYRRCVPLWRDTLKCLRERPKGSCQ